MTDLDPEEEASVLVPLNEAPTKTNLHPFVQHMDIHDTPDRSNDSFFQNIMRSATKLDTDSTRGRITKLSLRNSEVTRMFNV